MMYSVTDMAGLNRISPVYRTRLSRHLFEAYAASEAAASWLSRTAAGGRKPCRSLSQLVLLILRNPASTACSSSSEVKRRTQRRFEFATLEWVDWFNNRRLLKPIDNIPLAEAEVRYHQQLNELAMVP